MRDSGLCCEGPKVRAASFARSWGWEGKLLLLTLASAQDPVSLAALSWLRAPVHRVLLGDSFLLLWRLGSMSAAYLWLYALYRKYHLWQMCISRTFWGVSLMQMLVFVALHL